MHLITYNQSLKYHSRPHGLTPDVPDGPSLSFALGILGIRDDG